MNAFTIRHANLQLLASRYTHKRDLAIALQREESQISRYLNKGCRIGHTFARHVEHALALPAGWMDTPQCTTPLDPHPLLHSVQRFIDTNPDPELAATIARLLTLLTTK